jgi:hypothetical protein
MEKNGGGGNDGRIDTFDLCGWYISQTFLEARQSDEVS